MNPLSEHRPSANPVLRPFAEASTPLQPLVVLVGPTAIGKSRIAIEVARDLGTEILTADSTQVYRGMNIGTDTPSEEDRQRVPHRLIDLVEPDEPFNAGEFRRQALREISRLYENGLIPLVVGGTGLYVRALLRGLWAGPPSDRRLRRTLEEEARARGGEALYQELGRVDPATARRLHSRDTVKVLRALEVYRQTGVPLSKAHEAHREQTTPFRALLLGLTMERAVLYQRIDQRVDVELAKGLVDETRALLAKGYSRDLVSMKSLGYRQMAGYLEGEYSFDEAVRRLKRDTRHFAKRQMTWFRKEPGLTWIEVQPDESVRSVSQRVVTLIERFVKTHQR
ncbi:MAG: tRNA (adenosine(37)-N6)-dimethylallyltransferase MiaA [Nitrospira sp.]|nr:tRNA (adenosine(37)-N6)-dimethylallyltransferase MiaA [Nitrospira sp.]